MQPLNLNNIDETNQFKERLTIALKAAKICVFEVDLVQQLYTFFENSEDIFGVTGDIILKDVQQYSKLSPDEYRVAASTYFSHPDDEAIIAKAFNDILSGQSTTYQARMRAGGSNFTWCKIDVTPILKDNQPIKMIGVITDISNIKRKNDFLKQKANIDAFSGVYNKDYAITLIKKFLIEHKAQSHAFVVLDIDNFKLYNDSHGHLQGDRAIKEISTLIKRTFRNSEIVGRFGGDEFMILIKDFPSTSWVSEKIQPIIQFQNQGHSLTTSIGIAIYPQDATTFEDLFQKADEALYLSKKKRKSFTFYSQHNNF